MSDQLKKEQGFYDSVVTARNALGSILDDRSLQRLSSSELRQRFYEAIDEITDALQIMEGNC